MPNSIKTPSPPKLLTIQGYLLSSNSRSRQQMKSRVAKKGVQLMLRLYTIYRRRYVFEITTDARIENFSEKTKYFYLRFK